MSPPGRGPVRPIIWSDPWAAAATAGLLGWLISIELGTSRSASRDAARSAASDEQVVDTTTSRWFDLAALVAVVGAPAVSFVSQPTAIRARRTSYFVGMGVLAGSALLSHAGRRHLGRFHRADLTMHDDHELIDSGPYRRVRHPLYAATIGVFLGAGAVFGNWVSIGVALMPIAALLHRIDVEERMLLEALDLEYSEYRRRTDRLIPGVW